MLSDGSGRGTAPADSNVRGKTGKIVGWHWCTIAVEDMLEWLCAIQMFPNFDEIHNKVVITCTPTNLNSHNLVLIKAKFLGSLPIVNAT